MNVPPIKVFPAFDITSADFQLSFRLFYNLSWFLVVILQVYFLSIYHLIGLIIQIDVLLIW